MDIISMAQHARPKPSGQMELLRAQFTALSSVVKMMPSSSRSLPKSSGLVSVTCLPSDVLMVLLPSYFRIPDGQRQISTEDTEFAEDTEKSKSCCGAGGSEFEVEVGGGDGAHAAKIGHDGAGPERGDFAGIFVLIPTVAAAGLPDGAGHAAVDLVDEGLLHFLADFEDPLLPALHKFQAIHGVADLGFNHQDHGIVAQASVRAEQYKQIGKSAYGDA